MAPSDEVELKIWLARIEQKLNDSLEREYGCQKHNEAEHRELYSLSSENKAAIHVAVLTATKATAAVAAEFAKDITDLRLKYVRILATAVGISLGVSGIVSVLSFLIIFFKPWAKL